MSLITKAISSLSISEVDEMFFGALISGAIDGPYILKIKKDFCVTDHTRKLYDIVYKLQMDQGFVDYLSVITELSKSTPAPTAKALIDKLTKSIIGDFSPEKAIELLEESFLRRNTEGMLVAAKQAIQESPKNAAEILYALYEQVDQLTETKALFSVETEFETTAQDFLSGNSSKVTIKTGYETVDRLTGGLSRKDLTIVGARPGHGKTTLCVDLIPSILDANPNVKMTVFQLEMSLEAFKRKVLASASGVSSLRMRLGQPHPDDAEKLKKGVELLKKYQDRLFIFDNVFDLFSMHKINRTVGADICLVDFITLMTDADESNLRLSLGRIMKSAKRFAKAHNMNYTFFSQLNRGQEFREDKIPTSADLAESDYLTQLAAEIWLLYYKFKYSMLASDKNSITFIFDKTRYSGISSMPMYIDPDLSFIMDKPQKGK